MADGTVEFSMLKTDHRDHSHSVMVMLQWVRLNIGWHSDGPEPNGYMSKKAILEKIDFTTFVTKKFNSFIVNIVISTFKLVS